MDLVEDPGSTTTLLGPRIRSRLSTREVCGESSPSSLGGADGTRGSLVGVAVWDRLVSRVGVSTGARVFL